MATAPPPSPLRPSWYGQTGTRRAVLWPLRATLRLSAALGVLALGLPTIVAVGLTGSGATSRRAGAAVARSLLHALGVRRIGGSGVALAHRLAAGPPPPPGYALVANHLSWLDGLVVLALFRTRIFVIAWLVDVPLLGHALRAMGMVPVDRHSVRSLPALLRAFDGEVRDGGAPIAFFPEADTTRGTAVAPFHAALIEGAVRVGAPLYPIAISYATPRSPVAPALSIAWADWTPLALHLWRAAHVPAIAATVVRAGPPVCGAERRRVARELHAAVSAAFGGLEQAPPDLVRRCSRRPPHQINDRRK